MAWENFSGLRSSLTFKVNEDTCRGNREGKGGPATPGVPEIYFHWTHSTTCSQCCLLCIAWETPGGEVLDSCQLASPGERRQTVEHHYNERYLQVETWPVVNFRRMLKLLPKPFSIQYLHCFADVQWNLSLLYSQSGSDCVLLHYANHFFLLGEDITRV